MTVGTKISLACVAIAGLAAAMGCVSLSRIEAMSKQVNDMVGESLPHAKQATKIRSEIRSELALLPAYLAATTPSEKEQASAEIETQVAKVETAIQDFAKSAGRESTKSRTRAIRESFIECMKAWREVRSHAEGGGAGAYQEFRRGVKPSLDRLLKQANELAQEADAESLSSSGFAMTIAAAATRLVWILLIFTLIASGAAIVFVFFSVSSLNRLIATTVQELGVTAGEMVRSTRKVAEASLMISKGASNQASALEETAASSQQISSLARSNSENTHSAASNLQQADLQIQQINQKLDNTLNAMKVVNASASRVSAIIKLIDEISFQTNILSLNAAVEAARAGEAGLGFSVVANEVRNLARRCSQAATDTSTLIEESASNAKQCDSHLNATAVGIRSLTTVLEGIRNNVEAVDAAGQEQTAGMNQISVALLEIQRITEQNAVNAQNTASESESLTGQTSGMAATISKLAALTGSAVAA